MVFGNAITSRISSSPNIKATKRSKPSAIPPCGGPPYLYASSKKPKRSSACFFEYPTTAITSSCTLGSLIRIEPEPSSVPLSTISYKVAYTLPGSDLSNFMCSFLGAQNRWCLVSHFSSSRFHSKSGKFTIQQNFNSFSFINSRSLPRRFLNLDNTSFVTEGISATNKIVSPFFTLVFFIIFSNIF